MNLEYDLLIVGAGPVGLTAAERASALLGWRSLVIDKRNHISGNCHDEVHSSGVIIHKYGPHYFRTNNEEVYEYLSKFTKWIPGNYLVKSYYKGEYYDFPINLNTLEKFFKTNLDSESAENLLKSVSIKTSSSSKNAEEYLLSKVGQKLYEAFYLGYTKKQWGLIPRELDSSVCARVPVRFDRNPNYVTAKHIVMPEKGYSSMFANMVNKPGIKILLNTSYDEIRNKYKPKRGTVYCGPIDSYFGYSLGKLTWRSLEFEFKQYDVEYKQDVVQINYPNENEYTRSVEIKHVTKQKHSSTVVSYEYPKTLGEPYYPVLTTESQRLYGEYKQLADLEKINNKVYFAGRLANFSYINIDEAIAIGLKTIDEIIKNEL